MSSFDVVVVGAGIVGASFALALKGADVSVGLVAPQPPLPIPHDDSWDSRVYREPRQCCLAGGSWHLGAHAGEEADARGSDADLRRPGFRAPRVQRLRRRHARARLHRREPRASAHVVECARGSGSRHAPLSFTLREHHRGSRTVRGSLSTTAPSSRRASSWARMAPTHGCASRLELQESFTTTGKSV